MHMVSVIVSICFTVNNFQSISEEIFQKSENLDQSEELARMKKELNDELTRHDMKMNKARHVSKLP